MGLNEFNNQLISTLFRHCLESVFLISPDKRIHYVNPAGTQLLKELQIKEMPDKLDDLDFKEIPHPFFQSTLSVDDVLSNGESKTTEYNDEHICLRGKISAFEDASGPVGYLLFLLPMGIPTGISKELKSDAEIVLASAMQMEFNSSMISSGTEDTFQKARSSDTSVEKIVNDVESISTNIDDMTTTISNVSEKVSRAVNIISNVRAEILNDHNTTAQVSNFLSSSGKEMTEVVNSISEIASRIDLLTINAAIEAAKAGEKGKGFALVADEIGRLSLKTTAATTKITDLLINIKDHLRIATEQVAKVSGRVEEIKVICFEINKNIEEEREVAERIQISASSVVKSARGVKDDVAAVRTVAEQASQSSQMIQQASSKLSEIAMKLNTSVKKLLSK